MTQQTNGTPDLNYSKETFLAMYEALKRLRLETNLLDNEKCDHDVGICWCAYKDACFMADKALALADGRVE